MDQFHTAEILGNGKLYEHRTPLSVKRNILALREQVPHDGTKKVLFGFSLGGMLALEWAHAHPEEVEAVILVNCSLNNSAFYKRITPYSISRILRSGFEKNLHNREEMIIRMTTANVPTEQVSQIALQWGPRGKEYPVKPMNFIWQLGVASQISQRASPPPVPVLVLSSLKDRVVHPDCSKKIADTWKLPLYIHPEAGHDLTLEDPNWVLDHVSRFIYPEADNYDVKTKLPASGLRYDPYQVLDVAKLGDVMGGVKVTPTTKQNMPDGINIEYNHSNMVHFRMDHQFNYESRSPGGLDDNSSFGAITAELEGDKKWALMRSKDNSIRMTTLAYRFSPVEFSFMNLKLAVTKDVVNADPVKGKTGKDDSAFQVWFTIRDGRANGDRTTLDQKNDKVFLFGYYYAGAVGNENRKAGNIFENWYSNKNIVIATLPESKQLLLNNPDALGKAQNYQRDLAQDLKNAFPDKNVNDLEILAITIQHDSDDTDSSSEAYFKSLNFKAK